ncbi:MAG: GLPGLI family protein [Brumimicrobium sp.]|nr:GLPGLI family protein [Brumimicrobium sp.]
MGSIGSNGLVIVFFMVFSVSGYAQMMSSGRVVYERRTNLEKRYEGEELNRWMRGGIKKPKIDEYELFFTDSSAIFKPILPEVPDEREWATMQNTTYQNLETGLLIQEFSFWGTKVYMKDSIKDRTWIITDSKRNIAGYDCRQALWIANDTLRIYAWYAEDLMASVGPETFNGLPGVILGLATEDGGVVYFAKKVERIADPKIESKIPEGKKKDWYTEEQLRQLIVDRFSEWGQVDRILVDMFVW